MKSIPVSRVHTHWFLQLSHTQSVTVFKVQRFSLVVDIDHSRNTPFWSTKKSCPEVTFISSLRKDWSSLADNSITKPPTLLSYMYYGPTYNIKVNYYDCYARGGTNMHVVPFREIETNSGLGIHHLTGVHRTRTQLKICWSFSTQQFRSQVHSLYESSNFHVYSLLANTHPLVYLQYLCTNQCWTLIHV